MIVEAASRRVPHHTRHKAAKKTPNKAAGRRVYQPVNNYAFSSYVVDVMKPRTHTAQATVLLAVAFLAATGGLAFVAANAGAAETVNTWDVASDTWVATDALGRSLPTAAEVGPPRPGRFVGVFYFLWLGRHGDAGPFDISKILARDPAAINHPESPLWGPLYAPHHWGESIFSYYRSDDEGVLRKHAQMLGEAGVDVIIFDVTNQLTYPKSWRALCRVFAQARREGNRVPQIAFLCPFGDPHKVVCELWDQLYRENLYPELWFRWQGKPLIMADPALFAGTVIQAKKDTPTEILPGHTLGQSFAAAKPFLSVGSSLATWKRTDSDVTLSLYADGPHGKRLISKRFENIVDNGWTRLELASPQPKGTYYLEISEPRGQVAWWSHHKVVLPGGNAYADGVARSGSRMLSVALADSTERAIRQFFTFRKPQPDYFTGPRGLGEWGWLEVFPQHAFCAKANVPEQVTVGVAQNAVDGRLSVLSNPRSHGRSFHAGREPGPEGQDATGRNFAEQWQRALDIDPPFIFVTGWNEWIAGRFDIHAPFYQPGPVTFVDEFDPEYSRDIEPMRGGHGDNYYYQMIANIRRYKGVRPIPPIEPQPITIDGRFADWQKVRPEFRDTIGDPVHRDAPGWGKQVRYVNHTGRNDIVAAKVSYDRRNVYFYVRTRDKLTPATDPNWMLLFIDADSNPKTGWLGYDFVINRIIGGDGTTSLQRNIGGRYQWGPPQNIPYRMAGNELELAVPWDLLGTRPPATLDFKWADNIQQTGDWSDFTLNGDAAPNDRFNYRAKIQLTP